MADRIDEVYIVAKVLNETLLEYYNDFRQENIYIVTPKVSIEIQQKCDFLKFCLDSSILNRTEFDKSYNFERQGWYYQQFLKYCLVLKIVLIICYYSGTFIQVP